MTLTLWGLIGFFGAMAVVWGTAHVAELLLAQRGISAEQDFRQRFPPISDEEYLARFDVEMNPQIALKVRQILSEALGVEYERIYPESRLVDDLGAE